MSSKIIRFKFRVADVLTNVTSAVLSDPADTPTYGVKRDDTGATVVAAGVSMGDPVSTGIYSYTFDDPAGYTGPYTAWIKILYAGATYHFERNIAQTASVSVGGMTVSYTELKERVGRGIFGIRTGFSDEQLDDINDSIRSGLLEVYGAHPWSFLRPVEPISTVAPVTDGAITIASGVVTLTGDGYTFPTWAADGILDGIYRVDSYDNTTQITLEDTSITVAASSTYSLARAEYDLPPAFDAFDEEFLTFEPEQSDCYPPIPIVHESRLRERRQHYEYNGRPVRAATRTVEFDSSVGSRKKLVFYPTPDAVYLLNGRMRLRPVMIDDSATYPIGSELMSELLYVACRKAAELSLEEREGPYAKQYVTLLGQAIRADLEGSSPKTLGPDRGGERTRYRTHVHQVGPITFNNEQM